MPSDRPDRARLVHELRVPLPPDRAMHLFTPAGERLWAEGWDPSFPAGEHGDGSEPGTVFTTGHDDETTFWTVAARDELLVRYARVTPERWSGLVEVRCEPDGGGTRAQVTYDLTALSEAGRDALGAFARDYEAYIGEWEQAIGAAVAD
jgi:Polyketide cyclase / dehydrase and lipid transport